MAAVGKGMPKNSRQTIRRLMHYLNEDKAKMTLAFACVIVNTVATHRPLCRTGGGSAPIAPFQAFRFLLSRHDTAVSFRSLWE